MPHSTLTIGNVEITVLHDAEVAMPLNGAFPDVSLDSWAPYQERYPEAYTGSASFRVHFECYLVRSQGRTLLIDTGLGTASSNPAVVANIGGGTDGLLLTQLQAAGFKAGDIDTVFLTHLHPDHVGWNMTRNGDGESPTFTNARYIAHEADWTAFNTPRDSEIFGYSWWAEMVAPLRRLGVLGPGTRRNRAHRRAHRHSHTRPYSRFYEPDGQLGWRKGVYDGRRVSQPGPGY